MVDQQKISQLQLVLRSWKKVNKLDSWYFGLLVAIYEKPKDKIMRWTGQFEKTVFENINPCSFYTD